MRYAIEEYFIRIINISIEHLLCCCHILKRRMKKKNSIKLCVQNFIGNIESNLGRWTRDVARMGDCSTFSPVEWTKCKADCLLSMMLCSFNSKTILCLVSHVPRYLSYSIQYTKKKRIAKEQEKVKKKVSAAAAESWIGFYSLPDTYECCVLYSTT